MPSRTQWLWSAAVGATLALHPVAGAQIVNENGPKVADAEVERLVRELDSDDPLAREAATQTLATGHGLTLRQLERFLADASLSREQRRRLLSAAFERFRPPSPRAALGVSFEPTIRESGVRINHVVPAFPSAGLLKAGDRVLTFDGSPVRDQQHAVAMIIAHDPGEALRVELIRDGEPMTLDVPLGRRDLLDNPVPVAGQMLADAWAVRSQAYASEEAATVIDAGLDANAWINAATPAWHEPPSVVAGGEARGGFEPGFARASRGREAIEGVIIRPQPRQVPHPGDDNLMIQRRLVRDQIDTLQMVINQRRELLRRVDIGGDRKRHLQQEIIKHLETMRELERMLALMEAQAGGGPPR